MSLRNAIPARWKPRIRSLVSLGQLPRLKRVDRILRETKSMHRLLPIDELAGLESLSHIELPRSDEYSPDKLNARGAGRASKLAQLLRLRTGFRTLELGGGDGMTSAHLVRLCQAEAKCIDILDTSDRRAHEAGVMFQFADAHSLPFADGEFDLVFSFAAFEHFGDPQKVFNESLRVVRPGGNVYLEFGPLYYSPYGLHAYKEFRFPYPQILFDFDDLKRSVSGRSPQPDWVRPDYLNRYRYDQYRTILDSGHLSFETRFYDESLDLSGLEFMEKYPVCFKVDRLSIKDFVTNALMVLVQRT